LRIASILYASKLTRNSAFFNRLLHASYLPEEISGQAVLSADYRHYEEELIKMTTM